MTILLRVFQQSLVGGWEEPITFFVQLSSTLRIRIFLHIYIGLPEIMDESQVDSATCRRWVSRRAYDLVWIRENNFGLDSTTLSLISGRLCCE